MLRSDLDVILQTVLGGAVDERLLAALDRRAQGNTLLLRELVPRGRPRATLPVSDGLWRAEGEIR